MYQCAIIGVGGPRAAGLAEAFRHLNRARLAAVSSRRGGPLYAFADRFGVPGRYRDYRTMLDAERPDLVLVSTPPDARLEILETAAAAGVPGVIIEKPVAIQGEDYRPIAAFASTCPMKIAVNHQLHYHPRRQWLRSLIQAGDIGDLCLIDASARFNLAFQGTHLLQAIADAAAPALPVTVFGQVSGPGGLRDNQYRHYAPDMALAEIGFSSGLRALLRCGSNAPPASPAPLPGHEHQQITVYGREGHARWTMHSWEVLSRGTTRNGTHLYPKEDVLAQAALTEAMLDWLDRETTEPPVSIHNALREFEILLAIYASALAAEPRDLPHRPPDNLIASLRNKLTGREDHR
jgi:predicted dehydrogenase